MKLKNHKIVLITGASSGIGWSTAEKLAELGYQLILCGRRAERLQQLTVMLQSKTNVASLCFDVSKQKEVNEALNSLDASFKDIDILINNAGNAHGLEEFHEADMADFEAMIDINIKGLLYLSKALSPQMVERNNGHIINISSIAGRDVYGKGHVYCGSKAAVDAITEGMRIDLHQYGIKVSSISPGLVETEFSEVRFKGDKEKSATVYQGYTPLKAEDVAECIIFAITRPAHVNIGDMLVLPKDQATSNIVHKKQ